MARPKFKVGDMVQLTVDSVLYYENEGGQYHDRGDKYTFIRPYEWSYIYSGNMLVEEVNTDRETPLYRIEGVDLGFYEFELEKS